ncbi:MAG: hypothetical protein NTV81_04530 [Candidatus Komeilibacteria bacterium]|nr:hypothetical protein [Candidatus Komeilibacteria bacterium]
MIIGVVLLVVIWPYFLAVFNAGNDYYTGVNIWAGADKPIYLSQIEQARAGHWLLKNLYTAEPQSYVQLSPVWLALGLAGKITTLSNVAIFQLGRILSALLLLIVLANFLKKIFASLFWRNLALLMVCFSSGLGLLSFQPFTEDLAQFGWFGTDLWISEGNTLLTLWHSPLFILSQLVVLVIFWWLADGWLKTTKQVWWGSLLILLLGLTHPYDLVLVAGVGFVWWLYLVLTNQFEAWPSLSRAWPLILAGFISGGYMIWLTVSQPAFWGWAEQNVTQSPAIWNYVTGYGLLVPLALIGAVVAWRSKNNWQRFLVVWATVQWYLLFLPVSFQRRLSSGLHLVMAILATFGFYYIWTNWLGKTKSEVVKFLSRTIFGLVVFIGLILTTGYYFYADWLTVRAHSARMYLPADEYQAMRWLKDNQLETETVLADMVTGNTLASVTGKLVAVGHGHQTVNSQEKFWFVERIFYAVNDQDQLKKAWLKANRVGYVYVGPLERALGNFQPEQKNYLQPKFQNQSVTIYQVYD